MAFFGAGLSYQFITRVREPQGDLEPSMERSFLQNLRGLPDVFSADRRLQLALL